ncbi:lysosomal acid phosphatase-like [Calliopsis andreniformis]|uniref:lysosomal acid phosphatase-like n=1 Tax=Calliopsis andreniformis TaxID=337506 RepID=UPI003FCCFFD2
MDGRTEHRPNHNRHVTREKLSIRIMVIMLSVCIGSVLFAYVAVGNADCHEQTSSIRQAIFVFRHGDRTPTETYPKDPYKNYEWPGGWGSLTKEGMVRMYNVGRWIRDRYGSIIGPKYESRLSLIQSSYADRCIMSAQVLLAALYPPTSDEIFVPGLNWRPVPVHSTPRQLDKIIVVKAPCPRLNEALKEAYANESTHPESLPENYYRELSAYTGQKIATITDVELLYNIFEIEEQNGLKLPAWTSKYYNREMREIAARSLAIFTSNTLQQRLRGGPLLKEILQHMQAFANRNDTRRAYFYSAHDITLVNLLRTIGFTSESLKPKYGTTLVFQLHAIPDVADDMEVKLVYLNDTDEFTSHSMQIPNCNTPCLLGNLTNLWKAVLPEDWDQECLL